jgi:hypothetical protein
MRPRYSSRASGRSTALSDQQSRSQGKKVERGVGHAKQTRRKGKPSRVWRRCKPIWIAGRPAALTPASAAPPSAKKPSCLPKKHPSCPVLEKVILLRPFLLMRRSAYISAGVLFRAALSSTWLSQRIIYLPLNPRTMCDLGKLVDFVRSHDQTLISIPPQC